MDSNVTRARWIDRCAMRPAQLHAGAVTDGFQEAAEGRWNRCGDLAPETAAEGERAPNNGSTGKDTPPERPVLPD